MALGDWDRWGSIRYFQDAADTAEALSGSLDWTYLVERQPVIL